jgi:hypothetical protein
MRFFHAQVPGIWFTTNGTDIQDFGPTNLNTYNPNMRWVAKDESNISLIMDLGVATSCNAIAFTNHNLNSCGTIVLEADSDPAFGTAVVIASIVPATSLPYFLEFATVSYRYWRLKFTALIDRPYLAGLFIGTSLAPTHQYQFGYRIGDKQFNTVQQTVLNGGLRSSQFCPGREAFEILLNYQNGSMKNSWIEFVRSVCGSAIPFYFVDHNNEVHYVHFAENYTPAVARAYNVNDVQTVKMLAMTADILLPGRSYGPDLFYIPSERLIL